MPRPASDKGDLAFYVFVEDIEALDWENSSSFEQSLPAGMKAALTARRAGDHSEPTHLVWLDAIEQNHFDSLNWADEACEVNNPTQGAQRRADLLTLDPERMRTLILLVDPRAEDAELYCDLRRAAWHRIVIGDGEGTPVVIASDFEQALEGDSEVRNMLEADVCIGEPLQRLLNVFNVDFVPDLRLDEYGSPVQNRSPVPEEPPGLMDLLVRDDEGESAHDGNDHYREPPMQMVGD